MTMRVSVHVGDCVVSAIDNRVIICEIGVGVLQWFKDAGKKYYEFGGRLNSRKGL